MTRRDRIDYLVIETTGVANPLPIALTFLGTDLREFTHLDSIVTVVDAEAFTPIEHYHSDVAIDRIFCGDIIILNKTDLVSEDKANKVEDFLRSVKEGARILRSASGKVPLSLMLDTNLSDPDFFDKAITNITVEADIAEQPILELSATTQLSDYVSAIACGRSVILLFWSVCG